MQERATQKIKMESGFIDIHCLTVDKKNVFVATIQRQSITTESRRDQQEGGELDSQEEASPEQIKSREVVLGYRESWTSFASVVSQRRSYGHCLCDCSA